jgi:hypothetical protein
LFIILPGESTLLVESSNHSEWDRGWRFWSTTESIARGQASVAAVVETVAAVIFYLWLASQFGFAKPLFYSIICAPFVLMRTKSSVRLGVRMLRDAEIFLNKEPRFTVLLIGFGLIGIALQLWVFSRMGLDRNFISITAAVVIPVAAVVSPFLVLSLAIRTIATLKNLREGMKAIPYKFRVLVLCISPSQLPEFVPGANRTRLFWSLGTWVRIAATQRKLRMVFFLIAVGTLMLPSWFFRFTVKSSAWFWGPLSYLGQDLRMGEKPELLHWQSVGSLTAKANVLSSCLVLLAFGTANIGALFQTNPLITPFGYLLLFQFPNPWQFVALGAAGLSLLIVFWINDIWGKLEIARSTRDADLQRDANRKLGWLERVMRVRLALSLAFWGFAIVQFAIYINDQACLISLPDWIDSLILRVYGLRFHSNACPQS